jgi:hypothetical protein
MLSLNSNYSLTHDLLHSTMTVQIFCTQNQDTMDIDIPSLFIKTWYLLNDIHIHQLESVFDTCFDPHECYFYLCIAFFLT